MCSPGSLGGEVIRCSSRKGERELEAEGLRVEAEGKMSKFKIQMTNVICQISKFKWRNLWESGKTGSKRESKIFSPSFENEGAPQAIFATKRTLEWSKKDF